MAFQAIPTSARIDHIGKLPRTGISMGKPAKIAVTHGNFSVLSRQH